MASMSTALGLDKIGLLPVGVNANILPKSPTPKRAGLAGYPGVGAAKEGRWPVRKKPPGVRKGHASHAPSFEQMTVEHGITLGERSLGTIPAEAAHIHFQLGIEIVGVMEDETLRHQRQARRPPLRQGQMA